jgi:OOP family OmpA-OmpF porin
MSRQARAADYNQKLSEQRAEAVRQALVARFGIAASRLTAQGFGLTRPVESNAAFEGRARNRRVEVARPCPAAR